MSWLGQPPVTLIRTSESGKRIDIVKLCCLDQGRDDSPVLGPTAGSGKQRVFCGDVPIGVETNLARPRRVLLEFAGKPATSTPRLRKAEVRSAGSSSLSVCVTRCCWNPRESPVAHSPRSSRARTRFAGSSSLSARVTRRSEVDPGNRTRS